MTPVPPFRHVNLRWTGVPSKTVFLVRTASAKLFQKSWPFFCLATDIEDLKKRLTSLLYYRYDRTIGYCWWFTGRGALALIPLKDASQTEPGLVHLRYTCLCTRYPLANIALMDVTLFWQQAQPFCLADYTVTEAGFAQTWCWDSDIKTPNLPTFPRCSCQCRNPAKMNGGVVTTLWLKRRTKTKSKTTALVVGL